MSPVILPVALKEPNQEAGFFGSPLRVTRIGLPVRFTLASRARQVALNLEIGTSSSTACLLPWSWTIVNSGAVPTGRLYRRDDVRGPARRRRAPYGLTGSRAGTAPRAPAA